jgi:hypothetical protein
VIHPGDVIIGFHPMPRLGRTATADSSVDRERHHLFETAPAIKMIATPKRSDPVDLDRPDDAGRYPKPCVD